MTSRKHSLAIVSRIFCNPNHLLFLFTTGWLIDLIKQAAVAEEFSLGFRPATLRNLRDWEELNLLEHRLMLRIDLRIGWAEEILSDDLLQFYADIFF